MHTKPQSNTGRIEQRMDRWWAQFVSGALAIVVICALGTAVAQESPSSRKDATQPVISPAKDASIRKFLELTDAKQHAIDFGQEVCENLISTLQKNLPSEQGKQIGDRLASQLTQRLNSDEFIARLVPVYDRAFSEEELQSINQFYESPAGRRLLEATPTVMEEAGEITENWIKELIPEITEQIVPQLRDPKQREK
jgi:uncharacterized protein